MLHDIGHLVLAMGAPEVAAEARRHHEETGAPLPAVERAVFGATHADLGGLILELWGVAPSIVEAVSSHHEPPDDDAERVDVGEAVRRANAEVHAPEVA